MKKDRIFLFVIKMNKPIGNKDIKNVLALKIPATITMIIQHQYRIFFLYIYESPK